MINLKQIKIGDMIYCIKEQTYYRVAKNLINGFRLCEPYTNQFRWLTNENIKEFRLKEKE